jgi:hypothetical protein
MSVTLNGGVTFGGGLTLTAGPPPVATAGWNAGGSSSGQISTIDRITFATDTATATARGPLGTNQGGMGGASTSTDGWFVGGYSNSPAPATIVSTVQRITYATDTATASTRGSLSMARAGIASSSDNTTYGWFGGGYIQSAPYYLSIVNRITYASDTTTSSVRGPLSIIVYIQAATGDQNYGWYTGGYTTGGISSTTYIDRITYATDTATATNRGALALATRMHMAVTDSTTYGWFAGGSPGSSLSTVQRITFATDTSTASIRGPLNATRYLASGTCNDTYGWFSGGYVTPAGFTSSTTTRITYATDTTTSTDRGNLSQTRSRVAGVSGVQ